MLTSILKLCGKRFANIMECTRTGDFSSEFLWNWSQIRQGTQLNVPSRGTSDAGTPVLKPPVSFTSAVAQGALTPAVFAVRLTVSSLVMYLIPQQENECASCFMCAAVVRQEARGRPSKEKDKC